MEASSLAMQTNRTKPAPKKDHSWILAKEREIIQCLAQPLSQDLANKSVLLGHQTRLYTLVLDLDETLVCMRNHKFNSPLTKAIILDNIIIRPYAKQFLEAMSEIFELVLFTAANKLYAYVVADLLDPEHRYFKKILSSEHCIVTKEGYYVKDLRIFRDRRQDSILMADNSSISFAFQYNNGVPVLPYLKDNAKDDELVMMALYLANLHDTRGSDSIVECNRKALAEVVEQT